MFGFVRRIGCLQRVNSKSIRRPRVKVQIAFRIVSDQMFLPLYLLKGLSALQVVEVETHFLVGRGQRSESCDQVSAIGDC